MVGRLLSFWDGDMLSFRGGRQNQNLDRTDGYIAFCDLLNPISKEGEQRTFFNNLRCFLFKVLSTYNCKLLRQLGSEWDKSKKDEEWTYLVFFHHLLARSFTSQGWVSKRLTYLRPKPWYLWKSSWKKLSNQELLIRKALLKQWSFLKDHLNNSRWSVFSVYHGHRWYLRGNFPRFVQPWNEPWRKNPDSGKDFLLKFSPKNDKGAMDIWSGQRASTLTMTMLPMNQGVALETGAFESTAVSVLSCWGSKTRVVLYMTSFYKLPLGKPN